MKRTICFIQDGLGGGGAEHVICNLANKFVEYGYSVNIGVYEYTDIAYELDKRVHVQKIDRAGYQYKNILDYVIYYFKKVMLLGLMKGMCKAIQTLRFSESRLYHLIKTKGDHYERKIERIEPIKKYIEGQNDAVIISFMTHCYTNAAEAIDGNKRNIFIISERDDPNALTGKYMISRRKKALALADGVVFQTEKAMQCLQEQVAGEGRVIPNPINDRIAAPYHGERKKVIVNFCRLNAKKNLPLLIDAFEKLIREFPEYHLHIYGRGEQKEDLLSLIAAKGLQGKAFIFDFCDNIHEVVKNAACFVSSSNYEGISNSMIEAMAIGMPVVCTDCPIGGASMFIQSYENGILTPVGDEAALCEAMKYILEHPLEAKKMGENALNIRDILDIDTIAKKWLFFINELEKQ